MARTLFLIKSLYNITEINTLNSLLKILLFAEKKYFY